MARVKQEVIKKAQTIINDQVSSPSFPSPEDLLESNRVLCRTVDNIKAHIREIPDKTLLSLIVDALDIEGSVTSEALWKRYRRATVNRDGLESNRDTPVTSTNPNLDVGYREVSSNGDTFDINRDTSSASLSIPKGISQTDLAEALGGFFESQGYSSVSLLKTCLMAMRGMSDGIDADNLKNTVDMLCGGLGITGE
jgi:hypothetical protein